MLRLIGILTGSAFAIAVLLFVLGTPRLSSSSGSVTELPGSGSNSELPNSAGQPTDSQTIGLEIPYTDSVTDPEPDPEPGSSVTDPELEAAMVEQVFVPEAEREMTLPVSPEPLVEEHWYAFWSPFRSEIAATGFVAKLQASTGIDYRVVKVKTGVYEVAFSYTDDADIEAKLDRISGATGLDLSGS